MLTFDQSVHNSLLVKTDASSPIRRGDSKEVNGPLKVAPTEVGPT